MCGGGGRGGSESIIASDLKLKGESLNRRWQMSIQSKRWRYVGRGGRGMSVFGEEFEERVVGRRLFTSSSLPARRQLW